MWDLQRERHPGPCQKRRCVVGPGADLLHQKLGHAQQVAPFQGSPPGNSCAGSGWSRLRLPHGWLGGVGPPRRRQTNTHQARASMSLLQESGLTFQIGNLRSGRL